MTNEIKRQIIKALAYGKSKKEIKDCMGVADSDIDSVTAEEVEAEKAYYKEMGYLQ